MVRWTILLLLIVSLALFNTHTVYSSTANYVRRRHEIQGSHGLGVRLSREMAELLLLTCCRWRNEATGADQIVERGPDKAETEMQRRGRRRVKEQRQRQGLEVFHHSRWCFCRVYTLTYPLTPLHGSCTDVPGGGQSWQRVIEKRKTGRNGRRSIERRSFFPSISVSRLYSRSVDGD